MTVPERLATMSETTSEVIAAIENWLGDLTVFDWVLLGVAGIAIYWVGATLRGLTNLGPVEVDPLEHDGQDVSKAKVQALTSRLREHLANTGLQPPPELPASAPQTDLISAVKASPIPQSEWLAKLLEIMPKPPRPLRYRVSGTLLGVDPSVQASNPEDGEEEGWFPQEVVPPPTPGEPARNGGGRNSGDPCGLSFWVKPSQEGHALLETVPADNHEEAVECAATKIFLHISNDAVHVFPEWARWSTAPPFEAYREGLARLRERDYSRAAVNFRNAAEWEPGNMLPRLQLAALLQLSADEMSLGGLPALPEAVNHAQADTKPDKPRDPWAYQKAYRQADALEAYLAIAVERPALVEARYRASVLSSMLASSCAALGNVGKMEVVRRLAITPATVDKLTLDKLPDTLDILAARESEAVLQLLQPWYTLIRELRLRNRYEFKGFDRRQLKRAVSISGHCVAVRSVSDNDRRWTRAELWARRAIVRYWHLFLGRSSVGWQAHYNAACFYALLDARAEELARSNAEKLARSNTDA